MNGVIEVNVDIFLSRSPLSHVWHLLPPSQKASCCDSLLHCRRTKSGFSSRTTVFVLPVIHPLYDVMAHHLFRTQATAHGIARTRTTACDTFLLFDVSFIAASDSRRCPGPCGTAPPRSRSSCHLDIAGSLPPDRPSCPRSVAWRQSIRTRTWHPFISSGATSLKRSLVNGVDVSASSPVVGYFRVRDL